MFLFKKIKKTHTHTQQQKPASVGPSDITCSGLFCLFVFFFLSFYFLSYLRNISNLLGREKCFVSYVKNKKLLGLALVPAVCPLSTLEGNTNFEFIDLKQFQRTLKNLNSTRHVGWKKPTNNHLHCKKEGILTSLIMHRISKSLRSLSLKHSKM